MRGRSSAVFATLELSDHPAAAAVVVVQICIQNYIKNAPEKTAERKLIISSLNKIGNLN